MKYALFCLVLFACASPSPELTFAEKGEVTHRGIKFSVHHTETRAQVIRHGYLTRQERAPVQALMIAAAEEVSGCRVVPNSLSTRIPGDTGVADVDLDCG